MNRASTIAIAVILAWLTHIFSCFNHATWGFLIAGAIMFPIGVLHGFYIWLVTLLGG